MSSSDSPAGDEFFHSVHDQLRRLAEKQMAGERVEHTLQATALVNEAWLSLREKLGDAGADPARFYMAAAEAMRCILIDHARRKRAQKRGGSLAKLSLDLVEVAQTANYQEVQALDEAISKLEEKSPRAAMAVRLRFFAGLSEVEAASTMGVSERTLRREWAFARAWLYKELGEGE
ncbi:MAG: ECF-type sigma factor [Planctomycetota bacterium]|jgi:RNA polymerase sigma factor (TIGR02999 family)